MKIKDTKMRDPSSGIPRKKTAGSFGGNFSIYSSTNKEELFYVDITKISPFEGQARVLFEDSSLESLAESIKKHGIRAPLTLLRKEDRFEVVSGERRLRAAKLADLKKVPAFVVDDKEEAESLSVIENVQRENLHSIELAIACKRLLDEKICKNVSDVSKTIGIHRTKISEYMGLLLLPAPIQEYLIKNKIEKRSVFRKLKNAKSEKECKEILGLVKIDIDLTSGVQDFSVLRLKLEGGVICLETNKISSLTEDQKERLKEVLATLF